MNALSALLASALALAAFFTATANAQPPTEKPAAFEVVSIKAHAVPQGGFFAPSSAVPHFRITGNRVAERFVKLQQVIMDAFDLADYQVIGGPEWARSGGIDDFYDIEATVEGGKPAPDQVRAMLRTFLADRFHFEFHKETRELPVYELKVDKDGLKMRAVTKPKTSDAPPLSAQASAAILSAASANTAPSKTDFSFVLRNIALYADRPVIDKTGLIGTTNITSRGRRWSTSRIPRGTATNVRGRLSAPSSTFWDYGSTRSRRRLR